MHAGDKFNDCVSLSHTHSLSYALPRSPAVVTRSLGSLRIIRLFLLFTVHVRRK